MVMNMEAKLIEMGEQSLRAAGKLALLSAEEKVKVLNLIKKKNHMLRLLRSRVRTYLLFM